MNEPNYTSHDPRLGWPQQYTPPSPFVTHEHLAPIHNKIGSLEKGQESVLNTYAHLRGEMLAHFDRLEKLVREDRQAAASPPPEAKGVIMSMHSVIVAAVALVLAGIILSRIPGIENMIGGS